MAPSHLAGTACVRGGRNPVCNDAIEELKKQKILIWFGLRVLQPSNSHYDQRSWNLHSLIITSTMQSSALAALRMMNDAEVTKDLSKEVKIRGSGEF